MIVDEVEITLEAGKGGDGHVSFRREKYVPKGGPDGGDGGNGGSIYFATNHSLNTLTNYANKKYFHAQDGQPGGTAQKSGKAGDDLILEVPPGTIIYDKDKKQILADLTDSNKVLIAKGGRGGWGNVHFKSSTNQAPQEYNPGTPGQKINIKMELKMIADVGLIGFPNSGKSTLLARITQARPKIADYPFTTLEPNLGVAKYHDKTFVIADIPGLIEGASSGKGLGIKFLKHIERTKILAHLIDINEPDIIGAYEKIRQELKSYSTELYRKLEIIVITKIDTKSPEELDKIIKSLIKHFKNNELIAISTVTGKGLDQLLKRFSSNV